MHGGDGVVIWSEADLAQEPAQRERLARAVRDVRSVERAIGRFRPEPCGVALVHSAAAVSASWARDARDDGRTWPRRFQSYQEAHGSLEVPRRRWLDELERAGAMPGALPIDEVGPQIVARFPLLVLDHLIVLDDAEFARIQRYLKAGGRVCVAGELGWIDRDGSTPARPRLEVLEEGAAGRVLAPPEDRSPAGLARWLAASGVERAPARVAGARAGAWITTWIRSGDGWICAAMPELGDGEHLASMLSVDAGPRARVEWIRPQPAEDGSLALAAGDAALFRVLPAR